MKKLVAMALAGLVLVSAVIFFPASAAASEVDKCFSEHERCRENSFNLDAPWYQIMLFLTLCDLALAACILTV